MALKDEWKETGKDFGKAFGGFGKTLGRSAKTTVNKVTGDDKNEEKAANSSVYSDGSWRNVGKNLGGAFTGFGKTVVHSVKKGVDKLDDATKSGDQPADSTDDAAEETATPVYDVQVLPESTDK